MLKDSRAEERRILKKESLEIKGQLLYNLCIYFVKIRSVYAGVSFSTKSGRQDRLLACKGQDCRTVSRIHSNHWYISLLHEKVA